MVSRICVPFNTFRESDLLFSLASFCSLRLSTLDEVGEKWNSCLQWGKLGLTHMLSLPVSREKSWLGLSLGIELCSLGRRRCEESHTGPLTSPQLPNADFFFFFLLSGMLELLHWTLGFPRRLSSACDSACSQGAAGASSWATLDSIAETKACRLISWHLGGDTSPRFLGKKYWTPRLLHGIFACGWMNVKVLLGWGMRGVGWEWRMSRSSILPMSLLSLYPHAPSRTLGTWRHCNVLVFFPLTMYLVDSSAFVVWTFFCGSMAVDLKPDVYRLTWRANSKCRGPGSWSQGGPGPFLLTRFPKRFREGQRGEALLCGLLLCGCAVKNPAVSNFWKSRRGLKLGCDTLQSRSGESGVIPAFMQSPLAGGCHSWAVATVVCTCLRGHISEVPSLWTLSLFPPVLPFALCSFCLSQLCLRSAALLPLLPSNPPGTPIPRTVF